MKIELTEQQAEAVRQGQPVAVRSGGKTEALLAQLGLASEVLGKDPRTQPVVPLGRIGSRTQNHVVPW